MSQFKSPAEPNRRRVADSFYAAHCPESSAEIDYIDFFYPVRNIAIPKGTRLWGFTNAVAEGMNSKIMPIKRRVGGFRNRQNFKTGIFFYCGGLSLYPQQTRMDHFRRA